MGILTYCSVTEWCKKQGFSNFGAFSDKNSDYPTEEALTDMLEDATQLMNLEIGIQSTGNNISDTGYTTMLRNLCYRMALLMIDEEQARAHEQRRSQFIPRDYMFERDRNKLQNIGRIKGYRVVGQIG